MRSLSVVNSSCTFLKTLFAAALCFVTIFVSINKLDNKLYLKRKETVELDAIWKYIHINLLCKQRLFMQTNTSPAAHNWTRDTVQIAAAYWK